jgi:tetratricopeptide (TPR) repeat protein
MKIRYLTVGLCLSFGCQGLTARSERAEGKPPAVVQVATPDSTKPSHNAVAPADDALGQAAACVERGDAAAATEHLRRHVRQFPDQIMIRAYLAEMLVKMNKLADARDQFERFIADAQSVDGPAREHMLHCHTRLMEIAQSRGDDFEEHLHRGIGMVILARRLEASGDRNGAEWCFRERMLCKAASELTAAKKLRPDESRPHWYLVEVWTKLGQPRAAERSLKQAKAMAALAPLPPAEQSALIAVR